MLNSAINGARLAIDACVQSGVIQWCVSPGSRSTPLVLAVAQHPACRSWVGPDERSLGFFALGVAKATGDPVGIVVTSGTAGANLYPAIVEAFMSGVQLIILTADRPRELHNCGANQTINQTQLFGKFVHLFTEVPCFSETISILEWPGYFTHAVAESRLHSGPVHLNCPFREPFFEPCSEPVDEKVPIIDEGVPDFSIFASFRRPLIAVGALSPACSTRLLPWLRTLRIPMYFDITANLPRLPYTLLAGDLSDDCLNQADSMIHIGGGFVSSEWNRWMATHPLAYVHLQSGTQVQDPLRRPGTTMGGDLLRLIEALSYEPLPAWPESVLRALSEAKVWVPSSLTEISIAHKISTDLPSHVGVFCGNSLPIRAMNIVLPSRPYAGFWFNRGASGIDGLISTAAGIADAQFHPILAWIGDLSALHDLGALQWVKTLTYPMVLFISNNHGGGIFDQLPIANTSEHRRFFKWEHGYEFEHAARLFELQYIKVTSLDELQVIWPQLWTLSVSVVVELIF